MLKVNQNMPFSTTFINYADQNEITENDLYAFMSYAIGNAATMRKMGSTYVQEATTSVIDDMDHNFTIAAIGAFRDEMEHVIKENFDDFVDQNLDVTKSNILAFTETATYQFMNYLSDAFSKRKIEEITANIIQSAGAEDDYN